MSDDVIGPAEPPGTQDGHMGEQDVSDADPPPQDVSSDGHEVELKFLASEEVFKAMEQSPLFPMSGPSRPRRLNSTYFDTNAGDLQQRGITLRVRKQRAGARQTLKWDTGHALGCMHRGEIEIPTRSATPVLSLFGEDVTRDLGLDIQDSSLRPIFSTDIRRVTRDVRAGASEIEVSFDTGTIIAGGRRQPIREVELELKSGDAADLYQFGHAVASTFAVRLGTLTKADRGLVLATGTRAPSRRTSAPDLTDRTIDEAIGAIIDTCVNQFVVNQSVFEEGNKESGVHQMRVALRRLRSALRLFHRGFPCPDFLTLRAEASRIASALGEARNWDVFLNHMRTGPIAAFPAEAGFDAVMAGATARRDAGYDMVGAVLEDPATARFVLSALALTARRGWRNALAPADLSLLTEPASRFGAACLSRLHGRVRKRGRRLMSLSADERHTVRIAAKNLRYAAEFFGDLFGRDQKVRQYRKCCAHLQDMLGLANDTVVISDLARQLPADDPSSARALGLVIGWYGHAAESQGQDGELRRAWEAFRRMKAFWPESEVPGSASAA